MSVTDDGLRSDRAIPELERRKFYDPDDGKASYVRVIQAIEEPTNVSNEQLILNTLQKILEQAQLTNLYLEQIVGDNLGDGCG